MAKPIRPPVGSLIRTVAVLSVVLNTPVVAWVTRRVTSEPRVEGSEIECVHVALDLSRPSSQPLPYGDVGSFSNH